MANIRAYRLVETLQNRGLDVLLTGGLAVEGWSGKEFKTGDWDIVGGPDVDFNSVTEALKKLGYVKNGNVWVLQEDDLPPQNPGQFFTTQYLWGKIHTLRIVDKDIEVETVAPEWLYVDRARKVRRGLLDYAEQGLFVHQKFNEAEQYSWSQEFVRKIASSRNVPHKVLDPTFLQNKAGK